MGERGNICILEEGGGTIFLYTHWNGPSMADIAQAALLHGRTRWHDAQYFTRIAFCRMLKDCGSDLEDTNGFGISTELYDNGYPVVYLDMKNQKVIICSQEWTFNQFADEGCPGFTSMCSDIYSGNLHIKHRNTEKDTQINNLQSKNDQFLKQITIMQSNNESLEHECKELQSELNQARNSKFRGYLAKLKDIADEKGKPYSLEFSLMCHTTGSKEMKVWMYIQDVFNASGKSYEEAWYKILGVIEPKEPNDNEIPPDDMIPEGE